MRPTWIVLGLIVAVGAVAYLKLANQVAEADGSQVALERDAAARGGGERKGSAMPTPFDAPEDPADDPEALHREARAVAILQEIGRAHEARDRARYDAGIESLEAEAWDAPSARLFAAKLGLHQARDAARFEGRERIRRFDAARRLMSRGVWHASLFDEAGRPTPERGALVQAIQDANREVMTFGRRENGGYAGVTTPYLVDAGLVPVQIVSRRKLPYGPNALLYWNLGTLDAKKLRAGRWIALPDEELALHVNLEHCRVAIFIGDWFVEDYDVGVGRSEAPTPRGVFTVGRDRQRNPDWWGPNGFVAYGKPGNELGDAWIPIESPQYPDTAGYGIHGTNKPQTVGTRCSEGCVRLRNDDVRLLYDWVRTASAGGKATRVLIY